MKRAGFWRQYETYPQIHSIHKERKKNQKRKKRLRLFFQFFLSNQKDSPHPFSILADQDVLKSFNEDLVDLLTNSKFTVINVTIDKQSHLARYKYPEHPYHYCLQVMLERYAFWLSERKSEGDVMGESRGKEDLELKKEYRRIWLDGTMQKPDPSLFRARLTSKEIKIKPKTSNIPGLQIADLLAYPLKEKLLHVKSIRANFVGTFSEIIYKAVEKKIRQNSSGRTAGFGEIFLI